MVLREQTEHGGEARAGKYLLKEKPGERHAGFTAGGRPQRCNAGVQTNNNSEQNQPSPAHVVEKRF